MAAIHIPNNPSKQSSRLSLIPLGKWSEIKIQEAEKRAIFLQQEVRKWDQMLSVRLWTNFEAAAKLALLSPTRVASESANSNGEFFWLELIKEREAKLSVKPACIIHSKLHRILNIWMPDTQPRLGTTQGCSLVAFHFSRTRTIKSSTESPYWTSD